MGRPIHYSLDIVTRCRSLLAELMPVVQKGLGNDAQFGGPLSTTFAVAMANPIIGIFKPADGKDAVADDRALNPGLSDEVRRIFNGKTKFKDCPFGGH